MNNSFLHNISLSNPLKRFWPITSFVGVLTMLGAMSAPASAACLTNVEDFDFVPSGASQQVIAEYPRMFWRLENHQAENLQISVTDENARELYFWDYRLSQSNAEDSDGGMDLMSVQPSPNLAVSPMTVGSVQNWQLTLICDYGDRTKDIVINQKIERIAVEESLKNSIQALATPDKIELYLTQGLINSALVEFMYWQDEPSTESTTESTSIVHKNWLDFQRKAGIIESQ
ncbi:DUF928 domain-containing protein [[Limnothrix rosea] IAM M-220]|uniref:DUF928 domain-containing protein n=1 Tax=[Limnothrix rosea] IAM M-220 TaxID=454133 RepID=UPI0009606F50|nr:DUF928 domain-containing protein [[Limnothrix rosea] IAM M-220]OKH19084.1 hypothetical protein NIES208_03700 [[Limnothrix rosea] IAM M-220]